MRVRELEKCKLRRKKKTFARDISEISFRVYQ